MYENIITIDPSLTCTGIVVNGNIICFAKHETAWNKKSMKKWFNICDDIVDFNFIEYNNVKGYSDAEVDKLTSYLSLADRIIDKIQEYMVDGKTIVAIEGYSYQSVAGPLIDLVTLSTCLRRRLYELSDNLVIVSPSTLKLESAKLTYKPINEGKRVDKFVWKNNQGVKGGSFKKPDMFRALTENENIDDDWNSLLIEHSDEMLSAKNIPKPVEDINDAKLLYEILKYKINNEIPLDFIK